MLSGSSLGALWELSGSSLQLRVFIEDKLTSLEFDNAGNQTSPSDEEFEWNDDNAVVSNDAKHMKKNNEQNDQKCCCQR